MDWCITPLQKVSVVRCNAFTMSVKTSNKGTSKGRLLLVVGSIFLARKGLLSSTRLKVFLKERLLIIEDI